MKRTGRKNTKYSRNETILKISYLRQTIAHSKAIPLAKWSVWVKKQKCQKYAKNHSTGTLELFCAKNRSRKYQIFEKRDDFENQPSQAKGIAHAKMSVWVKN